MSSNGENCPICGADTLNEYFDQSFSFKHARKVHNVSELARTVCETCCVSMFLPNQITSNREKVKAYQAALKDYIAPEQILELREVYDLSQKDASKIFGGGPTAFSKYERGLSSPSNGAGRQMLAALRDPEFMKKIALANGVVVPSSNDSVASATLSELPQTIRDGVSRYAASLKISVSQGLIILLEKALEVVARPAVDSESEVNYSLDKEYAVRRFKINRMKSSGVPTRVCPIRKQPTDSRSSYV